MVTVVVLVVLVGDLLLETTSAQHRGQLLVMVVRQATQVVLDMFRSEFRMKLRTMED
jgi:hypothetical protein